MSKKVVTIHDLKNRISREYLQLQGLQTIALLWKYRKSKNNNHIPKNFMGIYFQSLFIFLEFQKIHGEFLDSVFCGYFVESFI